MKAIVCTRYGPPEVLQLRELEKPVPREGDVLIRVHATTVMAGDCELRGAKGSLPWQLLLRIGFGFRGPRRKVLGQDLAGEVESVGSKVTRFRPGDEVFGNTGLRLGAYAEYACLPENGLLAGKPSNMTFEEAAAVPSGGLYVLPLLGRMNVQSGEKVMIIGAAGTMGTIAVQLSKVSGAEVTGVDRGEKLNTVRSVGADRVLDYTKEDFSQSGERYDLIFDVTGKSSFSQCIRSLKENGTYMMGNLGPLRLLRARLASTGNKRVVAGYATYRVEDLLALKELIEDGKIRAVVDRRYSLEQTAEAHRYVETGQKAGNVVIVVGRDVRTSSAGQELLHDPLPLHRTYSGPDQADVVSQSGHQHPRQTVDRELGHPSRDLTQ